MIVKFPVKCTDHILVQLTNHKGTGSDQKLSNTPKLWIISQTSQKNWLTLANEFCNTSIATTLN